jgi:hypothetical protein
VPGGEGSRGAGGSGPLEELHIKWLSVNDAATFVVGNIVNEQPFQKHNPIKNV